MPVDAVAELFASFDLRGAGSVSADDAAGIASAFGPYTKPPTFTAGETFTLDAIQTAIDEATPTDQGERATALFAAVFGADVKADEAALAQAEARVTGTNNKSNAQRVLATFNARRLGATEFVALDCASHTDVPSRTKRSLLAKRGPKTERVVEEAARERHAAVDALFSELEPWESAAQLDDRAAAWTWEGALSPANDATGVVVRSGSEIKHVAAPKDGLPEGAQTTFTVKRNGAGYVWLLQDGAAASIAGGSLSWAAAGELPSDAVFEARRTDGGLLLVSGESALSSSGAVASVGDATAFQVVDDLDARLKADAPAEDAATENKEETAAAEPSTADAEADGTKDQGEAAGPAEDAAAENKDETAEAEPSTANAEEDGAKDQGEAAAPAA